MFCGLEEEEGKTIPKAGLEEEEGKTIPKAGS